MLTNILNRILLLLILFSGSIAVSQTYPVQVVPQVVPPYSLKLSDYATANSERLFINLILTDFNEQGRRVKLRFYLQGNGLNIQSNSFIINAPIITLEGGINQRLTNVDLKAYFELQNLKGVNPQTYSSPLPDGSYQYCFEVLDYFTDRPLSKKTCTSVYLQQNDPPVLNLPFKDDAIEFSNPQNVLFTWTPRHINAPNVQYEFTLKELWDNGTGNPQTTFLGSPALFQTTTASTTLLYGPGEPQFLSGKIYGWQVRAFSNDGISETSLFKNDGYSEIFWFRYIENCNAPTSIISESLSSVSVRIMWQTSDHLQYRVQYRKKGFDNDEDWFEVDAYGTDATIYNLEPSTTYEFRLGGTCSELSGFVYSTIQEFETSDENTEDTSYYNCGITPNINIDGSDPLPELKKNQTFKAGDFPVVVNSVSGSNGVFTGTGYITLPFLEKIKKVLDKAKGIQNYTRIKVEFENVEINKSFQLTKGVVKTVYDSDWGDIIDTDEIIDDLVGDDGDIVSYNADSLDVNEVKVNDNGKVVLIDEEGKEHPIETKKPVVIKSKDKQWNVDKNGNVSQPEDIAEGGAPTSTNTEGVSGNSSNNSNVSQISSEDVLVTFQKADGFYGTDNFIESLSSDKYKKQYEFVKINSNKEYPVLHKLVSNTPDYIIANVVFKNGKTKDDIVFKTLQGAEVKADWITDKSAKLTLTKKFDFAKQEIIATVKPKQQGGKFTIAGKFNLWHVKQKEINLTLVSVNGASIVGIGEKINAIYNKAGIYFKIDQKALTVNTQNIDVGDSGILSYYTKDEKDVISTFKSENGKVKEDQYYMFFFDNINLSKDIDGFMPLKSQFGFVFNTNNAGRIAAHELGHGVFGLKHLFDKYKINKEGNHYLMNYGSGEHFSHMDWQEMFAPGLKIYWFQKDEDGEHTNPPVLKGFKNVQDNNWTDHAFMTPSGVPITIEGVTEVLFNEKGALIAFKISDETYTSSYQKSGDTKFIGYVNTNSEYFKVVKKSDINNYQNMSELFQKDKFEQLKIATKTKKIVAIFKKQTASQNNSCLYQARWTNNNDYTTYVGFVKSPIVPFNDAEITNFEGDCLNSNPNNNYKKAYVFYDNVVYHDDGLVTVDPNNSNIQFQLKDYPKNVTNIKWQIFRKGTDLTSIVKKTGSNNTDSFNFSLNNIEGSIFDMVVSYDNKSINLKIKRVSLTDKPYVFYKGIRYYNGGLITVNHNDSEIQLELKDHSIQTTSFKWQIIHSDNKDITSVVKNMETNRSNFNFSLNSFQDSIFDLIVFFDNKFLKLKIKKDNLTNNDDIHNDQGDTTSTSNDQAKPYILFDDNKYQEDQLINVTYSKKFSVNQLEIKQIFEDAKVNWIRYNSKQEQDEGQILTKGKKMILNQELVDSLKENNWIKVEYINSVGESEYFWFNLKVNKLEFKFKELYASPHEAPKRLAKSGEILYVVRKSKEKKINLSIVTQPKFGNNLQQILWSEEKEGILKEHNEKAGKVNTQFKISKGFADFKESYFKFNSVTGNPETQKKSIDVVYLPGHIVKTDLGLPNVPKLIIDNIEQLKSKFNLLEKLNEKLGLEKVKIKLDPIKCNLKKYNEEDENSRLYYQVQKTGFEWSLHYTSDDYMITHPSLKVLEKLNLVKAGIYFKYKAAVSLSGTRTKSTQIETGSIFKKNSVKLAPKGCFELGLVVEPLSFDGYIDVDFRGAATVCLEGGLKYDFENKQVNGFLEVPPIVLFASAKIKTNEEKNGVEIVMLDWKASIELTDKLKLF